MRKSFVFALGFLLVHSLALARLGSGEIIGKVFSIEGGALAGVKVSLLGPAARAEIALSDQSGRFAFKNLTPASYILRFEKEGMAVAVCDGITVGPQILLRMDMYLGVALGPGVETAPPKPAFVKALRKPGSYALTEDYLEKLPVARDPWTVLQSAPGIMTDRTDVGGSDTGEMSKFFAAGWDPEDTTWQIDGAMITDPSAIGAAPAYLNINSYEELQVNLGANDITAQTGGIQLNFVTKRGGNKITGDFHLYLEDDAWSMKQDETAYQKDNGLVVPGVDRLYQYGVNLGGPIIKDKLWWFGSYAIQDIRKRTDKNLEDKTWLASGFGKLNFQLGNTSGDFRLDYDSKKKWGQTFLSPSQQDENSLGDEKNPQFFFLGSLQNVMGDLMLNLKTVYTDGGFTLEPRGSKINSQNGHLEGNEFKIFDNGQQASGSSWYQDKDRKKIDINLDGNYFLEGALGGDHEIRFGVDYFTADTTSQTLTPNQRITYLYRDDPSYGYVDLRPDQFFDVNFKRVSAYIQDTVTWGKLTASVGLRYDKETGEFNYRQPRFTWYEPGAPYHNYFIDTIYGPLLPQVEYADVKLPISWKMFSPRIWLAYDITGDGKNVVKLSAGRYMSQSGNSIGGKSTPFPPLYAQIPDPKARYPFHDYTGDGVPQIKELSTCEYLLYWPTISPLKSEFDMDFGPPRVCELTFGFEKALTDDFSVSLTGFYKNRKNMISRKGILSDGTLEAKDNWENTGTLPVGGTNVPVYEQIVRPVGWYYENLNKAHDRYLGTQLELSKKLSNGWMFNASFTFQDWKAFRFEEETLDMNNFDFFNGGVVAPTTESGNFSDRWINSKWMMNLSAYYQAPYGINISALLFARQGNPQPYGRPVVLNQGSTFLYQEGQKLGDNRLPTFWMLNLGLEKTFKITDRVTASVILDWYNATNNQIELKHNLTVGTEQATPEPVMWTNAGLFQFGVRVNF